MDNNRYLRISVFAKRTGITVRAVYQRIKKKQLIPEYIIPGVPMVDTDKYPTVRFEAGAKPGVPRKKRKKIAED
jgi:hypothetical protein